MKTLAIFALLSLGGAVSAAQPIPPRCDYGERASHLPDEFEQFEFLIGDYQIEVFGWFNNQWYPNPNATHPPRWNGFYGLQGRAIVDEWFNLDPGLAAETNAGINVRMYDSEAQEWKMMWISDFNHVVQDLRAKIIDGKLTMWQVSPERPDFKAVFEQIDENNWHRIEFRKDAEGKWNQHVKIAATRIACDD